ncbi:DUF4184 family protein [Flavihumibacter petaseus]|uniref:DUF4184 family protein n=1 Tax=Flavihumibacter petaseus NBRC 106054 TaxID=1220578 RepID=A0A0E9N5J0_9BACT|nr:DUF4184 family protein [Flavihumibacter petaseus]GAO44610.1 hypothetical protein FPE01S_03_06480 [Flavihumibacter petaseus NBRC 106054]
MPFTFSHPAIILPFTALPKRWYSLTGLVAGTIAPDMEYFLRMRVLSTFSHTLPGLFWFNLPVGVLLTIIFHQIIRDTLLENLPVAIQRRSMIFQQFDWMKYFRSAAPIVLLSVWIGAGSHLFWDSFTHVHGYFVDRISALQQEIAINGYSVPVFKLLQHVSSMVGGLVLLVAFWQLRPSTLAKPAITGSAFWYWYLLISGLILGAKILVDGDVEADSHLLVAIMSAMIFSLILTPILLKTKNKYSHDTRA